MILSDFNNDIFEIILKFNYFNKNILLNNLNKIFYKIISSSKYFDYQKKNYASNLIKLFWFNQKIFKNYGQICKPVINLKDPDLGYSMNNWLFVYYRNQNLEYNIGNYNKDYWNNNIIIEIHPFTILQYPYIKKGAIEIGLNYNTMVLFRHDIDFIYDYKKDISRILHN